MINLGPNTTTDSYDPRLWEPVPKAGASSAPANGGTKSAPAYDPKLWEPVEAKPAQRTPTEGEALRQQIEGKAPEVEDAPIANAIMAGALTPGALANLGKAGGELGIKAALKSGADFGVQQGLQDWVEDKLPAALGNHPWLKEALGIAGGTALYMGGHGAAGALGTRATAEGPNILQKIAESRALSEPEEKMAGTDAPIFESAKKEQPISLDQPIQEEPKPPEPPQPTTLQPKDEIKEALAVGDTARAHEALKAELNRHPDATVYDMRVGDMKRDPERFQYKTNVSRNTGADLALSDIQTYDRGLGNIVTNYHDRDGEYYVVNGHGRTAALERLEGADAHHRAQIIESRQKDDPEAIQGAIRYGYTPEQARGYGAIINIAEGRGTALDAARFFRSQGMNTAGMEKAGIALSPTEEKTQKAVALSRLSGQVFRAVDHGLVPEKLGVVIGRELGDNPTAQDGLYGMLKKKGGSLGDLSAQKLDKMIKLAKGSGETVEKSMTLFGEEEMKKSLMEEQADVINGIEGRLRGEKRLFGSVAGGAERIEQAGVGKVDPVTGERLSNVAAQNLDLLNRTAYSSGPVNEIVRQAAKDLAENPKRKAVIIREAYGKVTGELGKIIPEKPAESPQEGLFGKVVPTIAPASEKPAAPVPMPPRGTPEEGGILGATLVPIPQAVEVVQKLAAMLPEDVRNTPGRWGKVLQETFAPETDGAFAQRAGEIVESKSAELRARIGSAATAVRPLRLHFDGLDKTARYNLASQMEQGDFSGLPAELRPFGPAMKSMTDAVHDRLSQLNPERQLGYVDNYWRHLWANSPDDVRDAFQKIRPGKGLKVGAGFLKQRRFPTIAEGIDAGLTPKFANPVDQWLTGVQQEWRHVTGQEMWGAIKDSGIAKFYRVTQKGEVPRGYAKIDDAITNVLAPTEKGVAQLGDWYVPEEVARIFNNHLHPGMTLNPFASLSALGNRVRVEFSGFHFLLTQLSGVGQKVGDQFVDGLGDLTHGNIGRGALKMALAPARVAIGPMGVYRDWRAGRDVISKALGGHFDDPAVRDVILGGGSFDYAFDNPARVVADGWKQAFGLPQKLADKTGVIMKHWVAPLKTGTQLRLYNAALKRAYEENGNQELSFAQRRTIATQVRRHMDNIFGQIQRDNLHFSNWMKDATNMVVSYPGWQIGTSRLMGGAARGIGKGLVGSKLDMQAQLALRYTTGMLITGGTLGTLANLMMTGKMPTSVHDMFLWPTGDKDANGNEIRTEPPEYLVRDYLSVVGHRKQMGPNDVMAWPKAIGESAISKMNWPLAAASYIVRNADFFGKPITFPDLQSQPKQIQEIVKQFLKEGGVPFSISNMREIAAEGKSPARAVTSGLIGLTPESRALRQTPAQNFLNQYKAPIAPPLSPDQAQREQMLGQFEGNLRKQFGGGAKVDMAPIKDALRKGLITSDEVQQRIQNATKRPFAAQIARAPLPVMAQVWKIAHDNGDKQDEQDAAAALFTKIRNGDIEQLPPDQQMMVRGILRSFTKSLHGEESETAR